MAYMNKNAELKNGYNAYIDSSVDDMGVALAVVAVMVLAVPQQTSATVILAPPCIGTYYSRSNPFALAY